MHQTRRAIGKNPEKFSEKTEQITVNHLKNYQKNTPDSYRYQYISSS